MHVKTCREEENYVNYYHLEICGINCKFKTLI